MRIIYTDESQNGTLTANTETTGFPVGNVRHPFPTKTYRSTGFVDEWILWDFGVSVSINSIAIVNHNFISDGTVKFQGNASNAWGAPSVDETLTYDSGLMVKYFTGGSYRYWRLHLTQIGASSPTYDGAHLYDGSITYSPGVDVSYIQIGRVFFGSYWQPSKTFNLEWQDGEEDLSVIIQSIDGQIYADKRSKREVINLNIKYAPSADKTTLKTLFNAVGTHDNIILTLDQNNPLTSTYYGRIKQAVPITNHVNGKLSYAVQFEEAV